VLQLVLRTQSRSRIPCRAFSLSVAPRCGSNSGVIPVVEKVETPLPVTSITRLESLDFLRGIVMVLMALDHVRDFFTNVKFDPLDLTQTNPALFMTRWITHFCAPVFIFLAGTGAFLSGTRGKSKAGLSWFLFTRGLWLALLEITYVRCLGWEFSFQFHFVGAAVLWAIGWSMVVLAGLVFLPSRVVAAFGVLMIAAHNAFDTVPAEAWGKFSWLWIILHRGGPFEIAPGYQFIAGYPLVPWIGVMAAGYGFGEMLLRDPAKRQRTIFLLSAVLTALFVVLRLTNVYGNPRPWSSQPTFLYTVFSFLDCHKYPPSLLYVLMTLGPALMVLSWLDRGTPSLLKPLLVFGRVPLFYYLLHLPFIHGLAVLVALVRYGHAEWMFNNPFRPDIVAPPDNGFGLPVVYLVWILVVLSLYPLCRWFAQLKQRRREAWLSYL
jgi:uncharacterized membrane protein